MIDPADLRDVFDRAASLAPADRAAFLDRVCREKVALRREVERLLAADARMGSVFEPRASGAASGTDIEPTRSFAAGTQLGPYVVEALVGAGGMGEVYRARDTRLARTVAIKVLPSALTRDPTARQRFEREARAAAALAHPHICRLLDIGREREVDFLVMEYLDGETLAARLERGKLPVGTALTLGLQIATALAAAHRAGIVHRDLKPGNIMLARDGAMLLDFGLARQLPVASTDGAVATIDNPITRTGMILGTVQYMAPEQLDGRESDARTDVFAFGVVLYEMVTGRRAFEGTTHATLIGNILHADPPSMSMAAPLVPPALDRLIRRCLAKDPEDRWPSMADVQARLEALQEVLRDGADQAAEARLGARSQLWRLTAIAIGALFIVAAGAEWWIWRGSPARVPQLPPLVTPVQRNLTRLTFDAGLQTDPAFSPDGRFIAYASDRSGNFDIWVQPVAGGDAVQVTKSPANDTQPSWSPDGSTIAFRSERDVAGLYAVQALGGTERQLSTFGRNPSWSPDGREIQFLSNPYDPGGNRLWTVSIGDGEPRQLLPTFTAAGTWTWIGSRPDGRISFLGLHHARGYGFYTVSDDGTVLDARLLSHVPGALTDIVDSGGQRFQWNRQGTAVFLETETNLGVQNLWRARVDPVTLEWESVERLTSGAGADVGATVSSDGRKVAFGNLQRSRRLWRFSLDPGHGRLAQGQPITEAAALLIGSAITADGPAVLALARIGLQGSDHRSLGVINLWTKDLDSGRSELLVASNAAEPVWSPDHRRVAYLRLRPETIDAKTGSQDAALAVQDLGGADRLLSDWSASRWLLPSDWATPGEILVRDGARLLLWPAGGSIATSQGRVLFSLEHGEFDRARFSPDHRWLAFVTTHAGSSNRSLNVTRADGPEHRPWIQVTSSDHQVYDLCWSPDGRWLYFLSSPSGAFIDLWSMQFDPSLGGPVGKPIVIEHFDSPAQAFDTGSLHVTERQVFVSMRTAAGSIWMLDNVER